MALSQGLPTAALAAAESAAAGSTAGLEDLVNELSSRVSLAEAVANKYKAFPAPVRLHTGLKAPLSICCASDICMSISLAACFSQCTWR
jgi:hypothetical protein